MVGLKFKKWKQKTDKQGKIKHRFKLNKFF